MKLRKVHAVAAAAVVSMVLAACGGGSTTTTSTATTPAVSPSSSASTSPSSQAASGSSESGAPTVDANADLVIWTDALKEPGVKLAADKFAEANGVTVSVQVIAKDLQANFVTASQAGQGPDLVLGAHDWIGNLVQNGAIDPIQMDEATKAKFNPLAIKGVSFNGQVYGVPYGVENIFLMRNTDLAPTAPTSIEDMVAQGKKLVADGKVSEILALPVGQNGDAYHMYPFFTSGGGYLFGRGANGDYDTADLGLSKPEAATAMQKIGQLGTEGALKTSISSDNLISFFTDKKTAFVITGPWNIPGVQKVGVPFDISPIPSFEGGQPAKPFVGIQTLYVAAKGTHKTAAEEFANNYFATDEVALALHKDTGLPSALLSAYETEAADDPLVKKEVDAGKDGEIMPAFPFMNGVFDPFGKAVAAVVGGADPAGTISSTATQVQAAIK